MKKLLVILTAFMVTVNANALNCGETQSSFHSEESKVEVTTGVPKHLEGATITLTKADGSRETLRAEEYMIVKRKHSRPVIFHSTKETSMMCKNVQSNNKNIVSIKSVEGFGVVSKTSTAKTLTLKSDRETGIGLQYQRALTERLYLGGEVDTNHGVGILLGVGF